ncbi:MAG: hypothetical protein UT84_C0011G0021 [Candidatus Curtissbacteria bacterium GW2011_GWA1_40_16]|uniref:Endolytic murein transglycosylase n=1 Tax=Candidatus Curtissbacteria bacterium GW2011_GWA1_40_16 TaxID=1618405 RepID=A0A0G0TTT0_9BACT|nr:MAG: hypothetical protein UT84_C0011G0021 [Candidatus Curtissbacteria bacterium GW2011_GWA1_40_16]
MTAIKKLPVVFGILFVLLITSPVLLYKYYNLLLQPVSYSSPAPAKTIVITPGQPLVQVAANLEKEHLIKSAFAFRLLVAQMGISRNIQAGDFNISPDMSSKEIATFLTHGAIDVWVTIPEGLRIEEQADRIEQKLKFGANEDYKFDKKQYIQLAKEGYMFPDTYLIPKDATAEDVSDRFQQTFKQKVSDTVLNKGTKYGLSPQDVIILASLLEKEAKTSEEKPIIAGIFINRLNAGLPLQVDATVSYAKGYVSAQNTWWPQVTVANYQDIKSAYNTYLHLGLPPAPIASPGQDSINAAASPAQTDYYYYLHDTTGKIHYAKTAQEHNNNIQTYLQ